MIIVEHEHRAQLTEPEMRITGLDRHVNASSYGRTALQALDAAARHRNAAAELYVEGSQKEAVARRIDARGARQVGTMLARHMPEWTVPPRLLDDPNATTVLPMDTLAADMIRDVTSYLMMTEAQITDMRNKIDAYSGGRAE